MTTPLLTTLIILILLVSALACFFTAFLTTAQARHENDFPLFVAGWKVGFIGFALVGVAAYLFFTAKPDPVIVANRALDANKEADPGVRVQAIKTIRETVLSGGLPGWERIQSVSLVDPDENVRVEAWNTLAAIAEKKPEQVRTEGLILSSTFIDCAKLEDRSEKDSSPAVRIAAASFWSHADVLWRTGIPCLRRLILVEGDPQVREALREALAQRLERSCMRRHIQSEEADRIVADLKLRPLKIPPDP